MQPPTKKIKIEPLTEVQNPNCKQNNNIICHSNQFFNSKQLLIFLCKFLSLTDLVNFKLNKYISKQIEDSYILCVMHLKNIIKKMDVLLNLRP